MASFNVFQAENHKHIEIKWTGSGKSELPWEQKVRSCAVEILAYQVLMVCAANWPR